MRAFFSRRAVAVAAAGSFVTALALRGILRAYSAARTATNESEQWSHVRHHEQRFITALRAGSVAEGDDASI